MGILFQNCILEKFAFFYATFLFWPEKSFSVLKIVFLVNILVDQEKKILKIIENAFLWNYFWRQRKT